MSGEALAFVFRFRWILWGAGAVLLLLLALGRAGSPRLKKLAEKEFDSLLLFLCGGFFVAATVAKISQLVSLSLNAQDFWLFEDMLRNSSRGAPFVTRFAPQATGFVQHGAVHSFGLWFALAPLARVSGALAPALLFGPVVLALAGCALARLCRPRWGAAAALVIGGAFLLSSHAGKALTYDVHPETAYPLFVFLGAWGAGLGDARVRPLLLVLAALGGAAIHEASFLVLGPLYSYAAYRGWRDGDSRRVRAGLIALAVVAAVSAAHFLVIRNLGSGAWGPAEWLGQPVVRPAGPGLTGGERWESPSALSRMLEARVASHGGAAGALAAFGKFLVSRNWLSLVILAPWALASLPFWWLLLPLAAAYALASGQAALLQNYYAIPLAGGLWLAATLSPFAKKRPRLALGWLAVAALLAGSGGIEWHFPTARARELSREARTLAGCLGTDTGLGLVAPPLLGSVRREQVYSDRLPRSEAEWDRLAFALFAPGLPSYGMDEGALTELERRIRSDDTWVRVRSDCGAELPDATAEIPAVPVLYLRSRHATAGY
jgi:hypothetical protein